MASGRFIRLCRAALLVLPLTLAHGLAVEKNDKLPPKTKQAWTLQEAVEQLKRSPHDPYLQYVACQLAKQQAGKLDKDSKKLVKELKWILEQVGRTEEADERSNEVDLFSMFTGALAVQESLQLNVLNGRKPAGDARPTTLRQIERVQSDPRPVTTRVTKPVHTTVVDKDGKARTVMKQVEVEVTTMQRVAVDDLTMEKRAREFVDVATLKGPKVKSHPWKKMLAGKKPNVSPLARCVPLDCYFVEFRSLTKLLEAMDLADQWGTHLVTQAAREARTQNVSERLQTQLALDADPALRPIFDLAIKEVAVAGNDLFLREGSDVTVLLRVKQPAAFKKCVDELLDRAEKTHPDLKRTTGTFQGVDYLHLGTPGRTVNVYSAFPTPDLHVRSNSHAGFQRVLEAIQGKQANGEPVARLGDSYEFAFIRSLMPRGAPEEDGFAYLSDPFMRKQVSASVKLTERHRMFCYNHLRMIGHGSLLYRTQFGKLPQSLADLAKTACAPGVFGEGELVCPDGGKYVLDADGSTATCSHHGNARFLNPCCENYVSSVHGDEADAYQAFVKDYDQYWRTYFDPIAIRIQITPRRYRLETLVLPLSDNSIYKGLATTLGGKTEPLDALPVPKKNILTISLRLDKEKLLRELDKSITESKTSARGVAEFIKTNLAAVASKEDLAKVDYKHLRAFLDKGLGNQVGIHVYDSVPLVDLNLPAVFAAALAAPESIETVLLAASFSSPVYFSIPIQDVAIVDRFLASIDPLLTNRLRLAELVPGLEQDFYFLKKEKDAIVRGNAFRLGPVKVRFFSGRIGSTFYVAITSKPFIIDDLVALDAAREKGALKPTDSGPVGHAMVRLRPENWDQVLPDFRLGWAENNRVACLDNLAMLSSVARSVTAAAPDERGNVEAVRRTAEQLHAVQFFCPEGGKYDVMSGGKQCSCTVHGWNREPRQQAAPIAGGPSARLMRAFAGMTGTLTFREEGLQAVVVIERK